MTNPRKHSPGPWIVIECETSIGKVYRVGPPDIARADFGGICLYDDSTSLNPHESGEQKANAQLIAAAPELLEACKAANALLINDLVEPGRTVFWKLVAAIAKATKGPND